ncbi:MAG: multicopper oxidase family protein [Proteobacteria bacterium]|nr:multicopper oxidase family protein [Pseudomonadota bacterium]
MTIEISRRALGILAGSAATLPWIGRSALAGQAAPRVMIAETRTLDVNGKAARVFGLRGPDGRQGLTLAPGERFRVELANQAAARTIIHWHGQLPPWTQDGFPWPQTPPIASGASRQFDFAPIPGTYWMHSHEGLQEQRLMAAPLIVHSAAESREDRQEIVLMLHDFSFRSPDALLAGLNHMPQKQIHDAVRIGENIPAPKHTPKAAGMGMDKAMAGGTAGMKMPGMKMDLNDIRYDAFLANDRTLDDPAVVRIGRGGRLRLRIINGAASSQFWIDLGNLTGRVVAVDGHGVHSVPGQRFPIAIAQRLDILIDLPHSDGAFPITAILEGTARRTGIILATRGATVARLADTAPATAKPVDNSLEMHLVATQPLKPRRADLVHTIALAGGMKPYQWSMDGQYWPHITPLMLEQGQRVEIDLVNQSMMAHPMHLHGHSFQVIALDGRKIDGAMRDTVLVPGRKGARVRIAFDADNPGRWAFHCHNLYHMAAGMMTEFRYRGIAV